jgi:hypothetical protein
MASSYTTSLKIQQIGSGEQAGVWGSSTNTNWTLIEQAVAGVQTINMSNANYTLSNLNGVLDEARNAVLVVQGTNSGVFQVVAPLVSKTYVVSNQTTGGYAITIGGASGSVVTIANGLTTLVYCDGTNFYSGITGLSGNQTISGNLTVTGNGSFGGTLGVTGAATFSSTINSGAITATSFSGAGTGLTGTASGLSIGGNAATATSATSATNSTNAANLITTNFTVQESGGNLVIKYQGTTVAHIDSSGNFVSAGSFQAGGTP